MFCAAVEASVSSQFLWLPLACWKITVYKVLSIQIGLRRASGSNHQIFVLCNRSSTYFLVIFNTYYTTHINSYNSLDLFQTPSNALVITFRVFNNPKAILLMQSAKKFRGMNIEWPPIRVTIYKARIAHSLLVIKPLYESCDVVLLFCSQAKLSQFDCFWVLSTSPQHSRMCTTNFRWNITWISY